MSLDERTYDLPADHRPFDAQAVAVGGHSLDPGHHRPDTQRYRAGVDLLPADQHETDAQASFVGGHALDPGQAGIDTQAAPAGVDLLLILADALDDLEAVRIATNNRISALTRTPEQYGKGLSPEGKAAKTLSAIATGFEKLEHESELALKRALRAHPLGPWIGAQKGVGEKQGARLLASVGDPYWHDRAGRPRTVSELWAFCGFHVLHPGQGAIATQKSRAGVDPSSDTGPACHDTQKVRAGVAPARRKGRQCNWSPAARSRAWLVAESCMKLVRKPCVKAEDAAWAEHVDGCQCSPYRLVYDDARRKYADAVHAFDCPPCKSTGKAGMPLTAGHQHARALRLVAKRLLRDLWAESKRIHDEEPEP